MILLKHAEVIASNILPASCVMCIARMPLRIVQQRATLSYAHAFRCASEAVRRLRQGRSSQMHIVWLQVLDTQLIALGRLSGASGNYDQMVAISDTLEPCQ